MQVARLALVMLAAGWSRRALAQAVIDPANPYGPIITQYRPGFVIPPSAQYNFPVVNSVPNLGDPGAPDPYALSSGTFSSLSLTPNDLPSVSAYYLAFSSFSNTDSNPILNLANNAALAFQDSGSAASDVLNVAVAIEAEDPEALGTFAFTFINSLFATPQFNEVTALLQQEQAEYDTLQAMVVTTNYPAAGYPHGVTIGGATPTQLVVNQPNVANFTDTVSLGTGVLYSNGGAVNFLSNSRAYTATIYNTQMGMPKAPDLEFLGSPWPVSMLAFKQQSTAEAAEIVNSDGALVSFQDGSSAEHANLFNVHRSDIFSADQLTQFAQYAEAPPTIEFRVGSTLGSAQLFNKFGTVLFTDYSSLGSGRIANAATLNITVDAGQSSINNFSGGAVTFSGTATLGRATLSNNAGGTVVFQDSAKAGASIDATPAAYLANAGEMDFAASSSAGNANVLNAAGGTLKFYGSATAGSAEIVNHGSLLFQPQMNLLGAGVNQGTSAVTMGHALVSNDGTVSLVGGSAGQAVVTNAAGGTFNFGDNSDAGAVQLTNAAGGAVTSSVSSNLNSAHVTNAGTFAINGIPAAAVITNTGTILTGTEDFGLDGGPLGPQDFSALTVINQNGGVLDLRTSYVPFGRTLGSVSGAGGTIYLENGGNNAFGALGRQETLSTQILEAGANSPDLVSTLEKVGTGTLTFQGVNANYRGGTTVSAGTLQVDSTGSNTAAANPLGPGATTVKNQGTLNILDNSDAGHVAQVDVQSGGLVRLTGGGSVRYSTLNVESGGQVQLALPSGRPVLGALTGAGSVQISSAGTPSTLQVGALGTNSTFDGSFTGNGTLEKIGAGTLTLTNTSSHQGGTTISGGVLLVNALADLGPGPVSLNGGTLGFISGTNNWTGNVTLSSAPGLASASTLTTANASDALGFTGVISGPGGLTVSGAGAQTFSGANTFTGGLYVTAGHSLTLAGARAAGAGTLSVVAGDGGAGDDGAIGFEHFVAYPIANAGGLGADAQLTISDPNALSSVTSFAIAAGSGGAGGHGSPGAFNGTSQAGGPGGNGGDAAVTFTTAIAGNASTLSLSGSSGGRGGDVGPQDNSDPSYAVYAPGQAGGNGGNGGTIFYDVAPGTLDGVSTINLTGGFGGAGGDEIVNTTPFTYLSGKLPGQGGHGGGISLGLEGTNILSGLTINLTGGLTGAAGQSLVITPMGEPGQPVAGGGGGVGGGTQVVLGADNSTPAAGSRINFSSLGNGPAVLTLAGFGLTLASVDSGTATGANLVIENSGTTNSLLTVGDAGDHTFGGLIRDGGSGTLALRKVGGGTLALTGAGTYTGGTTITAGTLAGAATSFGSGPIVNNAALLVNEPEAGTLANVISGAGSVTLNGEGVVTMTGANSYTAATNLRQGTLLVAADSALGVQGLPGLTLNGGLFGYVSGNHTISGINFSSGGFATGNAADTLTVSATLGGPGLLETGGPGTVVLSGTNFYSGGTQIDSGALITARANLGSGDILDNGSLQLNAQNGDVFAQNISGSGSLTLAGTGTFSLTGTNTYAGGTTLQSGTLVAPLAAVGSGPIINNGTLRLDATGYAGVATPISGTGSLVVQSGGTVTVSGNNTYAGTTTVSGGTVLTTGPGALGTQGEAGLVLQGGSYGRSGWNDTSAPLATNLVLTAAGGGLTAQAGTFLLLTGTVSGPGALTLNGPGRFVIPGANLHTGGTIINGAEVDLFSPGSSLGSGNVVNNGTMIFYMSGYDAPPVSYPGNYPMTFSPNISGTGSLTVTSGLDGPAALTLPGANTFSGGLILQTGAQVATTPAGVGTGAVVVNGELDLNAATDATLANTFSGGSQGRIVKTGSGTVQFTGANYAAGIRLDLQAGGVRVNTGSFFGGAMYSSTSGTSIIFDQAFDGTWGPNGGQAQIFGDASLHKTGSGKVTLKAYVGHTGGTFVDQGELDFVDQGGGIPVLGDGPITVATGATLGGYGNLDTIGIHGPAGTLTIQPGATLATSVTTPGTPSATQLGAIAVNGAVVFAGPAQSTLNVRITGPLPQGSYPLLYATQGITGPLPVVTFSQSPGVPYRLVNDGHTLTLIANNLVSFPSAAASFTDALSTSTNWGVDSTGTGLRSSFTFNNGRLEYTAGASSNTNFYAQAVPVPGAAGGVVNYALNGQSPSQYSPALAANNVSDWWAEVAVHLDTTGLTGTQTVFAGLNVTDFIGPGNSNPPALNLNLVGGPNGLSVSAFAVPNSAFGSAALTVKDVNLAVFFTAATSTLVAAYSDDGGATWHQLTSFDVSDGLAVGHGWGMGPTAAAGFGVALTARSGANAAGEAAPVIAPGQVYFSNFASSGLGAAYWPAFAPTLTQQPQNQTALNTSSNVTFRSGATGTPAPSYQWQRLPAGSGSWVNLTDGPGFSGSQSPVGILSVTSVSIGMNGDQFRLVATNSAGTAVSNAATLTVAATAQTITFANPGDQRFSFTPLALTASASSGLAINYTVQSGPATVSGSQLTMTGTGLVTIVAAQPGDATYSAAAPVTQSFNIAPNFANWLYANFAASSDPAVIGPTVIRGQDGLPNLVKYALGLDPSVNVAAGLPAVSSDGTNWNYTFTKPASVTDVTLVVESSADLSNWSSSGVTLTLVSTNNGVETWRATVPLSGNPTLFFRLRVSQP